MIPNTTLRANSGTVMPQGMLGIALVLFLLQCVFNPADRVFAFKVWLYLLCWGCLLLRLTQLNFKILIPRGLFLYIVLFIGIPILSIINYVLFGSGPLDEAYNMLKAYLLITFAPLLVLSRIDILPHLCAVLTLLAISIISVFVILMWVKPEWIYFFKSFGEITGIIDTGLRDYGSEVRLLQIYFVSSPMIALSIAYYFDRACSASISRKRAGFWLLMIINALGMCLAGTRNNILVSFLLPIVLGTFYAKNFYFKYRVLILVLAVAVLIALLVFFANELGAFFDPLEESNRAKLGLINDYIRILSDPYTLIFGQGLGAYEYFVAKGSTYVSELTYFEMIRNFGLPGALIILVLLLFPIWYAFFKTTSDSQRVIAIGFSGYLVMCISNPTLFSSMGILLLCVILARVYLPASAVKTGG